MVNVSEYTSPHGSYGAGTLCDLNLARYGSGGIGGRSGGPGAGAGGDPRQHSKQNRRNPWFAMMPSTAVLFGIPEVLNKSSNCKSSEQKFPKCCKQ